MSARGRLSSPSQQFARSHNLKINGQLCSYSLTQNCFSVFLLLVSYLISESSNMGLFWAQTTAWNHSQVTTILRRARGVQTCRRSISARIPVKAHSLQARSNRILAGFVSSEHHYAFITGESSYSWDNSCRMSVWHLSVYSLEELVNLDWKTSIRLLK